MQGPLCGPNQTNFNEVQGQITLFRSETSHSWTLRVGLDQESRPIFPVETLKSGSLIGRRIEANLDEFRLGVKAITKH
jgi:hypothetical protein